MKTLLKPLLALSLLVTALISPLFAGALLLEIGSPAANQEALAKQAVLVARITACHSPERTTVTASAEGVVNGVRQSIPLKVISLSGAGTFAVTREWPRQGSWAVKMVATNADYKDYATSVVVPIQDNLVRLASVKHYSHAATNEEIAAALN